MHVAEYDASAFGFRRDWTVRQVSNPLKEEKECTSAEGPVGPTSGAAESAVHEEPKLAPKCGNEDLNLLDWSYDFVKEALETGQAVKQSWLYDELGDVLETKIEKWVERGVFRVEGEWITGVVTTEGLLCGKPGGGSCPRGVKVDTELE